MFEDVRDKKAKLGMRSYTDIEDSRSFHSPVLYPVLFVKDGPVYNTLAEAPLENMNLQLDTILSKDPKKFIQYKFPMMIELDKLSKDSKDKLVVNYFIELTEEVLLYIKSSCINNFATGLNYSKFIQFGFGRIFNVQKKFCEILEDNIGMIRVYIRQYTEKLLELEDTDEYLEDLLNFAANISVQISQVIYRLMLQAIDEEINKVYVKEAYGRHGIGDFVKNELIDSFEKLGIQFEKDNDTANCIAIKNLLIGLPLTMYENFLIPMCHSILIYMTLTAKSISNY